MHGASAGQAAVICRHGCVLGSQQLARASIELRGLHPWQPSIRCSRYRGRRFSFLGRASEQHIPHRSLPGALNSAVHQMGDRGAACVGVVALVMPGGAFYTLIYALVTGSGAHSDRSPRLLQPYSVDGVRLDL